MLVEISLQEFTQRLADGQATPGGGSAAALAGAMGASLVSMFCKLTAGRKKYAGVKEVMEEEAGYAEEWRCRLLALVDRDSAAYEKVLAANRLPKEKEEEKELRRQAIAAATLFATRTPLETATHCAALLQRIPPLAGKGNPNALSDLKVGMELLAAAFAGAIANVEINLPWLDDAAEAEAIRQEVLALSVQVQEAVEKGREEISRLE
jgi:glutamate formiminotransferase/formiminotetrahydrofolate cyclodeaminase